MPENDSHGDRSGVERALRHLFRLNQKRFPRAHIFVYWAAITVVFNVLSLIPGLARGDDVYLLGLTLQLLRGMIPPAFLVGFAFALEYTYERLDSKWGAAVVGAVWGVGLVGGYVSLMVTFPGFYQPPIPSSVFSLFLLGVVLFLSALTTILHRIGVNVDPFPDARADNEEQQDR